MTAREILKNEIADAESYHLGQGDWTNKPKAAALREIDSLLTDCAALTKGIYGLEGLSKRLKEAGYDEPV